MYAWQTRPFKKGYYVEQDEEGKPAGKGAIQRLTQALTWIVQFSKSCSAAHFFASLAKATKDETKTTVYNPSTSDVIKENECMSNVAIPPMTDTSDELSLPEHISGFA